MGFFQKITGRSFLRVYILTIAKSAVVFVADLTQEPRRRDARSSRDLAESVIVQTG